MRIKPLWNKYFVEESNDTFIQFFRYLFVGGLAAVVDLAASSVAVRVFGIYPVYAIVISFILGISVNYILSSLWIFRHRKIKKQSYDFLAFAIIGIIGLLLKAGIVWFLTEVQPLIIEFSNSVAIIIVFIWNFLARKYLLYNKTPNQEG
ncbi:MAG: GtrA family protein [Candidatus Cloacimonetes bacterium]|nr:GtrA family protein [Candidatus Cloacimonadota bacterium]